MLSSRDAMKDLLFVVMTIAFFALCGVYASALDRI
jgi:hypothetical protein